MGYVGHRCRCQTSIRHSSRPDRRNPETFCNTGFPIELGMTSTALCLGNVPLRLLILLPFSKFLSLKLIDLYRCRDAKSCVSTEIWVLFRVILLKLLAWLLFGRPQAFRSTSRPSGMIQRVASLVDIIGNSLQRRAK